MIKISNNIADELLSSFIDGINISKKLYIEYIHVDETNEEELFLSNIETSQYYFIPINKLIREDFPINNSNKEKLLLILLDNNIKKIGYDLKKISHFIKKIFNVELGGVFFDIAIASYVVFNNNISSHSFSNICLSTINNKGIPDKSFYDERLALIVSIFRYLNNIISSNESYKNLFFNIEMPTLMVLYEMEKNGILLDNKILKQQGEKIKYKIKNLEKKIFSYSGKIFNLNSPKQLGEILNEKLANVITKKTPKGAISTSEKTLIEISHSHPLPNLIIKYRELTKLDNTYISQLGKQISNISGKIHTTYNQFLTSTGRLSSSNPNIQNIPIKTQTGKEIRKAFICEKNNIFVTADYSQIELRLLAHLSSDENLINSFNMGMDIHSITASEIFDVDVNYITSDQRRKAKLINFGIIYGISSYGLSKELNISNKYAESYINNYFIKYPKILEYIDKMKYLARKNGYVETLFGRRIFTPNINSNNYKIRSNAERLSINAPIQGSAADIIKFIMVKINNSNILDKKKYSIIMQIHDELIFEVNTNYKSIFITELKKIMEGSIKLKIKLVVNISAGKNWYETL